MTANLSDRHALAIVENCPFPMLIMAKDTHVTGYNRAFAELVGTDRARELQNCGDPGRHPEFAPLVDDTSVCWTDRHDMRRHFAVSIIEIDPANDLHARLYIDITREVELGRAHDALNEELSQNILTDRVTGLLNQRGVMLALEPQVARSRRYNSPISVIMMEVVCEDDRGSAYLHVARLLKDQLRWADLVGCTDTREFMLVLPETSPEAAVRIADKLTRSVKEMAKQQLDGQSVATCYGVTGWRRSDNAETLLKRAGVAMIQARSSDNTHAVAL